MKNAVVFLADGFEEIEALTVVDYLRRGGVEVTTVAVPTSTMNDPYIVNGAHGINVISDYSFEEFKDNFSKDLPDLVYVPGGMPGSTNCASCKDLTDFLVDCFREGKHVAAICAAPAVVLAKTGILKGKKWTCYPNMEKDLDKWCGSKEKALETTEGSTHIMDVPFVTDGNVTTGRGPGCAEEFSMELLLILTDKETVNKVKSASIQR